MCTRRRNHGEHLLSKARAAGHTSSRRKDESRGTTTTRRQNNTMAAGESVIHNAVRAMQNGSTALRKGTDGLKQQRGVR